MRDFDFGELERDGDDVRVAVGVPEDLGYLEGHFPGAPIVPGVAQIVAIAESQARRAWPELGGSAGLRRVKFMAALKPGDTLELHLQRKPDGVQFEIARGDTECSRGRLVFR